LGWTRGANIEFDERWTTDNMDLVRANAANLVELKPDVIVAFGGRVIPVLMQLTRTVPIIIPGSSSPVEAGYIKSLARPGGNVTGFATLELSVIGRILETLKQIAPGTSRVAMIYNPDRFTIAPRSGLKRTWPIAVQMSAFDPKRTLVAFLIDPFQSSGAD
jgi:putative ABC transport system substrate-binding protein